jgi:hypothetical protein
MLHNLNELDLNPSVAVVGVIISGHSHKPSVQWHEKVLYFNPGSAGPRRFSLPISLGFLEITRAGIEARIVRLE